MYLKVHHVLENFRHLNLIALKLCYRSQKAAYFHSFFFSLHPKEFLFVDVGKNLTNVGSNAGRRKDV